MDDIIVTPFWTEEFCNDIVKLSTVNQNKFTNNIQFVSTGYKKLGWDDLDIGKLDHNFFQNYVTHFEEDVINILHECYTPTFGNIGGWFSPYIIRYTDKGQKADLHHDISHITINIKLNKEYQGCDLYFPRQNFDTKDIPVGYAVIWPSTVTHPHGSTELLEGTKYSFISWTWPPSWEQSGLKGNAL